MFVRIEASSLFKETCMKNLLLYKRDFCWNLDLFSVCLHIFLSFQIMSWFLIKVSNNRNKRKKKIISLRVQYFFFWWNWRRVAENNEKRVVFIIPILFYNDSYINLILTKIKNYSTYFRLAINDSKEKILVLNKK